MGAAGGLPQYNRNQGYGFLEGTTGVYERINRETCEVEMDLKKFFCLRSNLSNDDIIFA